MSISKSTQYGNINVSIDAIASLAGGVVTECYGVVGMASQKFVKDGIAELLKKDNYAKGVVVRQLDNNDLELDLYIIVSYGVKRKFRSYYFADFPRFISGCRWHEGNQRFPISKCAGYGFSCCL